MKIRKAKDNTPKTAINKVMISNTIIFPVPEQS